MKIGFSVSEDGSVSVNALTSEENAHDFAKMLEEDGDGEKFAGYLNVTDLKTKTRGDLSDALEALDWVISVNHFHTGSLCYAFEKILEQVFHAGREYENKKLREDLPADRQSALDEVAERTS